MGHHLPAIELDARFVGEGEELLDVDVEEADRSDLGFYIRNGIVVVVKNATIQDGTVI